MNQQEPHLTGRPIPPHLRDDGVVSGSPLNPLHPTSAAYELGRLEVRQALEANGTISSAKFEDAVLALIAGAVHEAYVNAQRAVAAIEWREGSTIFRAGQKVMQEDAVRAIREAAEENR